MADGDDLNGNAADDEDGVSVKGGALIKGIQNTLEVDVSAPGRLVVWRLRKR